MREKDNRNLDDWSACLEAEVKACRERIKQLELEVKKCREETEEFLRTNIKREGK